MKIEDIPLGILSGVRKQLGRDASYPDKISRDNLIQTMDAKTLMSKWAAWHLGSEKWGLDIFNSYEKLKKLESEEKNDQ